MGEGEGKAEQPHGVRATSERDSGAGGESEQDIEAEFDRCWPYLEAALHFAAFKRDGVVWPSHRKEHVWERVESGRAYFWPGKKSALITEIHESPTGLRTHHTWLAGGDLDEIVGMMVDVEEWGRQNRCHQQTGSGRRGWLRAFTGYHEVGVRKAKAL